MEKFDNTPILDYLNGSVKMLGKYFLPVEGQVAGFLF